MPHRVRTRLGSRCRTDAGDALFIGQYLQSCIDHGFASARFDVHGLSIAGTIPPLTMGLLCGEVSRIPVGVPKQKGVGHGGTALEVELHVAGAGPELERVPDEAAFGGELEEGLYHAGAFLDGSR